MKKNNLFIGYYGFWVKLTYINAVVGLIGLYFSLEGNVRYALICLMAAGLCDGFDGRIANLKKRTDREKNYGIQIDALADIISFGILPVFIGYTLIKDNSIQILTYTYLAISVIFVLAALIRLAYFNVIETELTNRNEKRQFFEGLPVTSVALIIPFVYSVCDIFNVAFSSVYGILLLVLSIAFVLRVKIPKPRGRSLVFLCLTGLPVIIYLIFYGGS
jgi:CDP-diacylglycerol--serine O-phosphatidyltransferase